MNKDVVEYYDSIANDYDESRFNNSYGRFIDAEERRVMNQLVDVTKDTLRLEVACGTGRLTNYATHGLDASSEMMAHAKKRHENVEFTLASATDTGFEDCTFDIVYSFHLMMHLEEDVIKDIFREIHRILKPGGRFIMDFPSKKRRELLHHKQTSWHGATHLTQEEIIHLAGEGYELKRSFGIMMFPVHKLPVGLRKPLVKIDYALANGWLKQYSSYLILEMVKK